MNSLILWRPAMKLKLLISIVVFMISFTGLALAKSPIYKDWWGHAIGGYDPVAYFTQNKPVEGSKEFAYEWKGAQWRFASQENLDTFKANPEQYAPQYGGYCAYGVAQGYAVSIQPDAWTILEGKLYLNYDQDVQKKWEADKPGFITEANKRWPGVLD